ncbi:transketolase C-terminal domain-containing protein [Sphaerisporangium sp. NPDC051017]|uniref:transketolase C-terminal domain-containing protein n=1 Tax=Sphaerisporangium sp. NPDC051017 TaxID=3154636 RepID=UPI00341D70D7
MARRRSRDHQLRRRLREPLHRPRRPQRRRVLRPPPDPPPILFVCEDNGLGISTKSPAGWVENLLRSIPGVDYFHGSGTDPRRLLRTAHEAAAVVRTERRPAVLHLETVRLMGHAGSDAEIAYRSRREIQAEYAKDPLLATARTLTRLRVMSPADILDRYDAVRAEVADTAARIPRDHLTSAPAVTAPLTRTAPEEGRRVSLRAAPGRTDVFRARLPEQEPPQTLAQTIKDAMAALPDTLVFGEDVARKGGIYGVTRGLQKTFGPDRVFDTLLDEQTVLGIALGSALAGFLPVPEIQYLAYLHNAEDQLRGEAAGLRFFSNGQYENGMVVRIAGLAYQKGFGGHFHNDNSLAVLRDIPGLVLAVPSHPASAGGLLRHCLALARTEGRVCVFLEPIALYHQRDLFDGDAAWLAPYPAPTAWENDDTCALGRVRPVRDGRDLLLVTFGNGVRMSLRAAATLARQGVDCAVLDLQWLAPLPEDALLAAAGEHTRILVVDETRRSGGVSEQVVATLLDRGHPGRIARVTGTDSFIPLGPVADHVLLSEDDIVTAAIALARHPAP